MRAIEIYKDEFFSLQSRTRLSPNENKSTIEFNEEDADTLTLSNYKERMKVYDDNRAQLDTRTNRNSSRSHAIFTVTCEAELVKVVVVDLAGS